MNSTLHTFQGSCHCGAIGFSFRTSQPPCQWAVRACQCSFCRAHGARTVTDAKGLVTFHVGDASALTRYRFGTRASDFLICGNCGVYIAALHTSGKGQFATVNVNTFDALPDVPEAVPVLYDGESLEQRQSRREQRWTPVAEAL
jgi:hypothetical protein